MNRRVVARKAPGSPRLWLRRAIGGSAVAAIIAGIVMAITQIETPLVAATFGLGAIIGLFFASDIIWRHLAEKDESASGGMPETAPAPRKTGTDKNNALGSEVAKRQMSPAMTAATSLAIQVQGVVLGLVFAFTHQDSVTVKVGVVSLGLGVIIGLLLYSLAAVDVSGSHVQAVAVFLFNLTLWTLSYGLLCIVAAFVAESPTAAIAH